MSDSPRFDPTSIVRAASDTLSVRRVFGEAYERDGVLVIPVAKVMGATGSGGGVGEHRPESETAVAGQDGPVSEGEGGGGGFGIRVRPVGVYVVDEHGTHWRPTLDLNRVILGGQIVGAIAISVLGTVCALRVLRRR
ncbi:spore germination protein GerW family protein [Cellulomonas soli]|uniref:spore germination protein GerW family protein n=1 Tax=Cellulomonas soli TaxID=931535 RepID=UPI003F85E843